jgi:hypothetical protein
MHGKRERMVVLPALALIAAGFGCQSFIAKDAKPLVDLNVHTLSQYNHRGMVMVDDWVLQPELKARIVPLKFFPGDDGGVVAVSALGILNLTEDTGRAWFPDKQGGKFSEVDFKAEYSRRIGPVDAGAGAISYILPNASFFPNGPRGTTSAVFGTIGGQVFGEELYSFYPHFTTIYDPDEANGFYFKGGLAKGVNFGGLLEDFGLLPAGESVQKALKNLNFEINAAAGYASGNQSLWDYGLHKEGFADFTGTGTLSYSIDAMTVFSIGVGGSTIIDDKIEDWFDLIDIDSDNIWVNIGIGFKFGNTSS